MASLYLSSRRARTLRVGAKYDINYKMSLAEQLAYYNECYARNEKMRVEWAAYPEKIKKIDSIQAELKRSIAQIQAKLR